MGALAPGWRQNLFGHLRSLLWAEKLVEKIGHDELERILVEGDAIDALDALQKATLG